ncbi:MAG: hypothetical protein SWK76_03300 [Actinomycetota bacterium]|nr:hypothetical protein [Actinomycetota bacterium]
MSERCSRDFRIFGVEDISLNHLYRAMAWLGSERERLEEELFFSNRDPFSSLSVVFFETTSIYFESRGGKSLGGILQGQATVSGADGGGCDH